MAKSAKKTVSKAKKPAARKAKTKPIDPISLQVIGVGVAAGNDANANADSK